MASDLPIDIDYGDSVELIDAELYLKYKINKGSVCGFRTLDAVQALMLGYKEGTCLVLLEDESGFSNEVPRQFLKKMKK